MLTYGRPRALFVVESPRFNVASAVEFGEIVYLFKDGQLNPLHTDNTIKSIRTALQRIDYDPDVDFVVMAGSSLLLALYFATVAQEWGFVRALMFDARHNKYVERVADFYQE